MRLIRSPKALQRAATALKRSGRTIALVPTMGFLHAGHLELVRCARARADVTVVSLFVNPTQFGPKEDFSRYPRDLKGDLKKLRSAGADIVFAPAASAMYPRHFQTQVTVTRASRGLCGESRPGHFAGVATVVAKLCNIVQPDIAVFGAKDYQQFVVIRTMARDLNLPVRVVAVPTVREADGLAMSSRNAYLSPEERAQASCLYRGLKAALRAARRDGISARRLVEAFSSAIPQRRDVRVDYVACTDARTLAPISRYAKGRTLVAAAVFIGRTRLIDNAVM